MGVTTLVAVEQYLSTTYRPDREYVDGIILERNLGEKDHSRLQGLLAAYLINREREWGIRTFPEQRVQVTPTRFRVPDVCIVAGEEPDEQIFTRPPLVCIEILSKNDTIQEMQERIDDYLRFGVPYVWIINPRARRAWTCGIEGNLEVRDGILRAREAGIVIPLAEIFDSMGME